MRERADYQNVFTLDEEDGRKLIDSAEELRKRISDHITRKLADT